MIILINPAFNIAKSKYDTSLSVGLLSLASYLSQRGIDVLIIDCARQKDWQEVLDKNLSRAMAVGLSVMTTQIPSAIELSKYIRDGQSNIKIIWGGVHSSFFPKQCIDLNIADFAVIGEGEETLYELLTNIQNGKKDFRDIKGIAFKNDNGDACLTEKRPLLSMQDIPLFDWNLMSKEVLDNLEIVPTHTSRGCPYRCSFCINAITQNRWRSHSADDVLKDLKIIKDKFFSGAKKMTLRFWDENFFVGIKRAKAVIDGILERDLVIPWETTVRADYLGEGRIDDEFLEKLKQSGCYLLSFGAESGSPRILEKIKKGITPDQVINSAKMCLKHSIIPQYSFMVGLPGEKKEDMMMTVDLIDKLAKLSDKVQILGPQAFRPYPGSPLYEECVASGWQAPKSVGEWAELVDNQLNYLAVKNFPWVKEKDLVDSLEAYVRFGAHSFKSAMGSSIRAPFVLKFGFVMLCKLRWIFKFFAWPVEFKLAKRFVTSL